MLKAVAELVVYIALFAFFLFVPAGTLHWRAAWIFLVALAIIRGVSLARLLKLQPELVEQRARFPLQKGQPLADKLLLPAFMATFAGVVAFSSWDLWHLHLFPVLPDWLRFAGLMICMGGWYLVHLALRENAYAVMVVRHQDERGQQVVQSGPYRVVRHPMYAGVVPATVGFAVWIGSLAGLLSTLVPIVILGIRITLEERVLRQSLPGYSEYAERVKWRLIPRIW